MASDANDCFLTSIVHDRTPSNDTGVIPPLCCLSALRWTDGNTQSECNQRVLARLRKRIVRKDHPIINVQNPRMAFYEEHNGKWIILDPYSYFTTITLFYFTGVFWPIYRHSYSLVDSDFIPHLDVGTWKESICKR